MSPNSGRYRYPRASRKQIVNSLLLKKRKKINQGTTARENNGISDKKNGQCAWKYWGGNNAETIEHVLLSCRSIYPGVNEGSLIPCMVILEASRITYRIPRWRIAKRWLGCGVRPRNKRDEIVTFNATSLFKDWWFVNTSHGYRWLRINAVERYEREKNFLSSVVSATTPFHIRSIQMGTLAHGSVD